MDSLDVYLNKKRERSESVKKSASKFRRVEVTSIQEGKRRSPRLEAAKLAAPRSFVPSTLAVDTSKFNFNGDHKKKAFVFSAVSSPKVLVNITNSSQSRTESPGKKFDLKASLARKLPYKPHKGKLKDLDEGRKKQMFAATKTKKGVAAPTKEGVRHVIKGVRLNKRAELLLQKRGAMAH